MKRGYFASHLSLDGVDDTQVIEGLRKTRVNDEGLFIAFCSSFKIVSILEYDAEVVVSFTTGGVEMDGQLVADDGFIGFSQLTIGHTKVVVGVGVFGVIDQSLLIIVDALANFAFILDLC